LTSISGGLNAYVSGLTFETFILLIKSGMLKPQYTGISTCKTILLKKRIKQTDTRKDFGLFGFKDVYNDIPILRALL